MEQPTANKTPHYNVAHFNPPRINSPPLSAAVPFLPGLRHSGSPAPASAEPTGGVRRESPSPPAACKVPEMLRVSYFL